MSDFEQNPDKSDPPSPGELQQALVTLRTRVDHHFDAAAQREGESMQCKRGCAACCRPGLSVFGVEAEFIRGALVELQHQDPRLSQRISAQGRFEIDNPHAATACALLVDGECSVYSVRPLLCRSHGLALREGAASAVSTCELNFQERPPDPQSVLQSQAVDLPLATIAELWRRNSPPRSVNRVSHSAPSRPQRVTLAELALQYSPSRRP